MKSSVRRMYRVFSIRLSARAKQQAEDVGEDHGAEREEQRVPDRAEQLRVVEDPHEVVEPDELTSRRGRSSR